MFSLIVILTFLLPPFSAAYSQQNNSTCPSCPPSFQGSTGCSPFQPPSNLSIPFPPSSPTEYSVIGPPLQAVHLSSKPPTGLAIDPNLNLYLTYPRNSGPTPNNVVICPTLDTEIAWPNASIQNCAPGQNASTCFINVQNVVLDSLHQLWVVDSGIPPGEKSPREFGAKIMSFDYSTAEWKSTHVIPRELLYGNLNLNDVRINNTLGAGGWAFLTEISVSSSLLAIDLATGHALRRLYNASVVRADEKYVGVFNGEPVYAWNGTTKSYQTIGADGIALQGGNLYWGVLASRRWYYVSQSLLIDSTKTDDEVLAGVVFPGQIATEQAGFTADDKGRVYIAASEHNAIFYVDTFQSQVTDTVNGTPPGGQGFVKPEDLVVKTLVRSALIQHADSAAVWDGWLYFCTNQLELASGRRYRNVDARRGPFASYRVWVGAGPAV